ncbi:MAG TPA: hypothetical protein VFM02_00825 [Candidatus Paceibacterota bacterium]|nr:hypothetical protein [Candidatus Paceibacterota bacterium]
MRKIIFAGLLPLILALTGCGNPYLKNVAGNFGSTVLRTKVFETPRQEKEAANRYQSNMQRAHQQCVNHFTNEYLQSLRHGNSFNPYGGSYNSYEYTPIPQEEQARIAQQCSNLNLPIYKRVQQNSASDMDRIQQNEQQNIDRAKENAMQQGVNAIIQRFIYGRRY